MENNLKVTKAISDNKFERRHYTEEDVQSEINAQKIRFYKSKWGYVRIFILEFMGVLRPVRLVLIWLFFYFLLENIEASLIGSLLGSTSKRPLIEVVSKIRGKPR